MTNPEHEEDVVRHIEDEDGAAAKGVEEVENKEAEAERAEAAALLESIEGENGSTRAQEAHDGYEQTVEAARERAQEIIRGAKMTKEALAALAERFETLDLTDEALDEQHLSDVLTGALEEHFEADVDQIADAVEGVSPSLWFGSLLRDTYRSMLADSDKERSTARKRVWKKSLNVSPLLAVADFGHNLWGVATKSGDEREAHIEDMRETVMQHSWLARMVLGGREKIVRDTRIRAQLGADVIGALSTLSLGLGPEVAAVMKVSGSGMETYARRLRELEKRAEAGEDITKGDVLFDMVEASAEIVGQTPEQLVEAAVGKALDSEKITSEGARTVLELVREHPSLAVEALGRMKEVVTSTGGEEAKEAA